MAARTFTINSANHTGIVVGSLQESLKFWEGLLGGQILYRNHMAMSPELNVIGVPDAVMDNAMVALPDGSRIELLEYSAPADRKVYKPRGCDIGSAHIALDVKGTESLIEEAAKLGWKAVDRPQRIRRGDGTFWTAIYIHGPDGETVEHLFFRAEMRPVAARAQLQVRF